MAFPSESFVKRTSRALFQQSEEFQRVRGIRRRRPRTHACGRRASCLVPWVSSIGVRCSALRELERSLGTPNSEFGDLIETAKMNRVEPFAYLKAALEAIAAGHPVVRGSPLGRYRLIAPALAPTGARGLVGDPGTSSCAWRGYTLWSHIRIRRTSGPDARVERPCAHLGASSRPRCTGARATAPSNWPQVAHGSSLSPGAGLPHSML